MSGFECEFVEKPPKAVQSECPVCLLVLREPYQATCCGKSFCKECIEQVKTTHQPCPTCNAIGRFDVFHNLGLQQSLNDFEVYCSHKSKSCEWRGELRELDKHLNSDPPADKSLEGCPFTVINCPLSYAGCEVKLPRREISAHVTEGAVTHTLLQSAEMHRVLTENHSLTSRVVRLERRNRDLETNVAKLLIDKTDLVERVASLEEKVKVLSGSVYQFTMPNFFRYHHKNREWSSPPFFTRTQGYRLCLICDTTGKKGDSYLSVYVCLMQGQFDEFLEWPIRGSLTVSMLDQSGYDNHLTQRITFDSFASHKAVSRVRAALRAEIGIGYPQFIMLSDLSPKYLKNECLIFKISDINF